MKSDIKTFCEKLDARIPKSLSESWDNDGADVIVNPDAEVKKVLVALDVTSGAIARAEETGADCIVTHHPLIFHALNGVLGSDSVGGRVIKLVQRGICALSFHTRLDCLDGGVNDCLASALNLKNTRAILPFCRVGELENSMSANEFKAFAETRLKSNVHVYGKGEIKTVAVASGAGKDFIPDAAAYGADCFLTGEVSHASIIDAYENGIVLMTAGHYATEAVVLEALAEICREILNSGKVETFYEYENFEN